MLKRSEKHLMLMRSFFKRIDKEQSRVLKYNINSPSRQPAEKVIFNTVNFTQEKCFKSNKIDICNFLVWQFYTSCNLHVFSSIFVLASMQTKILMSKQHTCCIFIIICVLFCTFTKFQTIINNRAISFCTQG